MALGRIFVANRGEIAVRVIRSCRRLGLETVIGVSVADRDSMGARLADRAVCIGPAPSAQSYLSIPTIVHAAKATACDALHPGYGFLSERAPFAQLCEEQGIIYVGPTAAQIDAVGDKLKARLAAIDADVPVVPGGTVDDPANAITLGRRIGVPLLVKAVGGGGGRGMKRVDQLDELPAAIELASAEAAAAFGDPRVYLERYVARGRHVEVQVVGDGRGQVVHLGERDCSVQRRYQKLIEETPAPGLPARLREDLHAAAVRFAARLQYRGAGTVEFLVDVDRGEFYFLEMNARIQVEHPVTEAVTGIDIVEAQLRIAAGEGLPWTQAQIRMQGCAVECRINAEDPAAGFRPGPGRVVEAQWPIGEGIRVDTHIEAGAFVPPYYDSLLAKIIAHGADRSIALQRLRDALAATSLSGVPTTTSFQIGVLDHPEFRAGGVDTGFLTRYLEEQDHG
jgi:acetyl-CoA carboxylase biotin carboxylase subunit